MKHVIEIVQEIPDACTLDFEAAMISTMQDLGVAQINLCYFHLKQSLLRQLKVRRIFNTFNKSTRFQEAVRDFLSLSFLKPEDALDAAQSHVLPQFQFVGDAPEIEDEEGAKVEVFFKYLHRTYLRECWLGRGKLSGGAFKIEHWSNYAQLVEERSLTNNGAEAVNSALRRETGARSHPQLCKSVRQLQHDVVYTAGLFADIMNGVYIDRNQARFDKKQAENQERLMLAEAYNSEELQKYFQDIKKYTGLF